MSLLKITGLHTPLCMKKHPWVIHREMCQNQNQCLPSADLGSLIGFGWTESWNAQSLGEGCFLTLKTENELHKPSRPLHKPKEEDNRKKKPDTWHIWRSQGRQGAKVFCGLDRGQSWCLNGPSHTGCRFVENPDSVMRKRLKPCWWMQQWIDQCLGQFQHRKSCNSFKWILEFITYLVLLLPSRLTPPNPRNLMDKVMRPQFWCFRHAEFTH